MAREPWTTSKNSLPRKCEKKRKKMWKRTVYDEENICPGRLLSLEVNSRSCKDKVTGLCKKEQRVFLKHPGKPPLTEYLLSSSAGNHFWKRRETVFPISYTSCCHWKPTLEDERHCITSLLDLLLPLETNPGRGKTLYNQSLRPLTATGNQFWKRRETVCCLFDLFFSSLEAVYYHSWSRLEGTEDILEGTERLEIP